jgi:hypothetical protein
MTFLKRTVVVESPFAQAADLVEQLFAASIVENGTVTLRLQAPATASGLPRFAREQDAVVAFRRREDPNQPVVFELHWESADGGPYPVFDGTLTVAQDETYESCRLILEGSYTPPGWLAGAAFDAAVGSRIAEATAQALLDRIRDSLAARHEQTEVANTFTTESTRISPSPESPGGRKASG